MGLAFDFGGNWQAFSKARVDSDRLKQATQSLNALLGPGNLDGRSFLDVGCGSGLFAIAAAQQGATQAVAFDISLRAVTAAQNNLFKLADQLGDRPTPHFCVADALSPPFQQEEARFDVVYAWGSLHHSGALWRALVTTAQMVSATDGLLVVAIYNWHWTSWLWRIVKRVYNVVPALVQRVLNVAFAVLIYAAVLAFLQSDPLRKERGMDFWYDVIDWIGGYPYEYASVTEVTAFLEALGFQLESVRFPRAATGNNEYIFRRTTNPSSTDRSAASTSL